MQKIKKFFNKIYSSISIKNFFKTFSVVPIALTIVYIICMAIMPIILSIPIAFAVRIYCFTKIQDIVENIHEKIKSATSDKTNIISKFIAQKLPDLSTESEQSKSSQTTVKNAIALLFAAFISVPFLMACITIIPRFIQNNQDTAKDKTEKQDIAQTSAKISAEQKVTESKEQTEDTKKEQNQEKDEDTIQPKTNLSSTINASKLTQEQERTTAIA